MTNLVKLAIAFATGAAVMYYLDPVAGRRRRALVRDQGVAARHDLERAARAKAKRASDRLHGAAARTRSRMADEAVDDDRLRERVRARLGHVAGHPGSIEVKVRDGRVVLSGTAASREEIDEIIDTVAGMPGVGEVDNLLAPDFSEHADVLRPQH